MSETRTVILLNPLKSYKDAFTNPNVFLYIPADDAGNIVDLNVATRLLCWKPDIGYKDSPLPQLFTTLPHAITCALLHNASECDYGNLARTVAFGSISKMEIWLKTLTRDMSGDLQDITVYTQGRV